MLAETPTGVPSRQRLTMATPAPLWRCGDTGLQEIRIDKWLNPLRLQPVM
jgi:hypothetical protein